MRFHLFPLLSFTAVLILAGCTAKYDIDTTCLPSDIKGTQFGWHGDYLFETTLYTGDDSRRILHCADGKGNEFEIRCARNTVQVVNGVYYCSTFDKKSVRVRVEWQVWKPK